MTVLISYKYQIVLCYNHNRRLLKVSNDYDKSVRWINKHYKVLGNRHILNNKCIYNNEFVIDNNSYIGIYILSNITLKYSNHSLYDYYEQNDVYDDDDADKDDDVSRWYEYFRFETSPFTRMNKQMVDIIMTYNDTQYYNKTSSIIRNTLFYLYKNNKVCMDTLSIISDYLPQSYYVIKKEYLFEKGECECFHCINGIICYNCTSMNIDCIKCVFDSIDDARKAFIYMANVLFVKENKTKLLKTYENTYKIEISGIVHCGISPYEDEDEWDQHIVLTLERYDL